jgi:hypothetical protein
MFKQSYIIGFFLVGLIGILIATNQIQLPKIFSPRASVIGVSMSILPSVTTMEPGSETTFDITLNPDEESVSAVELIINYDDSVIKVTDIKPTDALPQALALDVSKPGKATVILLVNPGSSKLPTGVIGRITVKAVNPGMTLLKFDQSTKVSAVGKTGDVIGAVEGAEVTVKGGPYSSYQPALNPSIQSGTTQADDLIKRYLEARVSGDESSESGNIIDQYSKKASYYIDQVVKNVNSEIEKQASKLLN